MSKKIVSSNWLLLVPNLKRNRGRRQRWDKILQHQQTQSPGSIQTFEIHPKVKKNVWNENPYGTDSQKYSFFQFAIIGTKIAEKQRKKNRNTPFCPNELLRWDNILWHQTTQRATFRNSSYQPCAAPLITKLFRGGRRSSSLDTTIESVDFDNPENNSNLARDLIETFLYVVICLIRKTEQVG